MSKFYELNKNEIYMMDTEALYESLISDYNFITESYETVEEGFFDKAKELGSKAYDKIVEFLKKIIAFLKSIKDKIVKYYQKVKDGSKVTFTIKVMPVEDAKKIADIITETLEYFHNKLFDTVNKKLNSITSREELAMVRKQFSEFLKKEFNIETSAVFGDKKRYEIFDLYNKGMGNTIKELCEYKEEFEFSRDKESKEKMLSMLDEYHKVINRVMDGIDKYKKSAKSVNDLEKRVIFKYMPELNGKISESRLYGAQVVAPFTVAITKIGHVFIDNGNIILKALDGK